MAAFSKPFNPSIHRRNHNSLILSVTYFCALRRRQPLAREPRVASWQEIDRIRKDPKAFRALAKSMRTHFDELTDWEKGFLTSIVDQSDKEEFTTRQSEKLFQIRDDYEVLTELLGGFSVKIILRKCWEARLDLSEDDEEWILQRFEQSPSTIRRKHAGGLRRCARELHLIEDNYDEAA
jgi:hypothetical protein